MLSTDVPIAGATMRARLLTEREAALTRVALLAGRWPTVDPATALPQCVGFARPPQLQARERRCVLALGGDDVLEPRGGGPTGIRVRSLDAHRVATARLPGEKVASVLAA